MKLFCLLILLGLNGFIYSQIPCDVPDRHVIKLYAIDGGEDAYLNIKNKSLDYSLKKYDGLCHKVKNNSKANFYPNALTDYLVTFKDKTGCFFCFRLIQRSDYVMQYNYSPCQTNPDLACNSINTTTLFTGYIDARQTQPLFNCKSIIEGVYRFTYKFNEYSGVCDQPTNIIQACQKQGSPLRDNNVFTMNFEFCDMINPKLSQGNIQSVPYKFTWSCLGRWVEKDNSVWSAIEFNDYEKKFRYRCFATRIDEQDATKQTWGLSASADCSALKTNDLQNSPIRLELTPTLDPEIKLDQIEPGCKLPINFTGEWFFPSEYHTEVRINSTHIYYKRKMSQKRFEEIYFVCIQYQEHRYLMATMTKGWCYLDYTCFHFLPRHHNIIRFRMGRPFRVDNGFLERQTSSNLVSTFRQACHWNSFTLNYVDWVYEYYILNPPEAVNCPIQGRFKFTQVGQQQELYVTKIPFGMTPRARLKVDCDGKWEPDFTACWGNQKMYNLDVSRCMRLDWIGRPISEYDIADQTLTCVGYWMEDTKSFLITYDPEDAVNENFRCWVYKRLDLNHYVMSRSQGTHCSKYQTAYSSTPEEGASLRMELTQNELEFDVCPMDFDDGVDPYLITSILHVFAAGPTKYSISIWLIPITVFGLFIQNHIL